MTWLIPSKPQQSIKKVPLRLKALEDKTVVTLMYFRRLFLSELLVDIMFRISISSSGLLMQILGFSHKLKKDYYSINKE